MKKLHIIFLLTLISFQPVFGNLPKGFRQNLLEVNEKIEKRWDAVKHAIGTFTPYGEKSDKEIIEEYERLDHFRKYIWHVDPEKSQIVNNPDYKMATHLLGIATFVKSQHLLAFDYNCVTNYYNASTILINGQHFIALEEPMIGTVHAFFSLLISQNVSVLVRLKPEGEYRSRGSINYWEDCIAQGFFYPLIRLSQIDESPTYEIPYCYTNEWIDNKQIDLNTLYDLVQTVRKAYADQGELGPIACHCSGGIGRTGAFIAAYTLANLLDEIDPNEISIQEIILKLSVQRPHMLANAEQYLTLYQFVKYYLKQSQISIFNASDKDYNL